MADFVTNRNLVSEETAERNRTIGIPGGATFNTFPPGDYEGVGFTFAAIRLGDHAHIEVESGRIVKGYDDDVYNARYRMGTAGKLVLRWHEWELLREILEPHENVRIGEVEKPTQGQAKRYA